jgi:hypothetical protein
MKVRELIEELQKENPEAEVIMSSDAEGNSYSPIYGFEVGRYQAENAWSGTFYGQRDLDPDDEYYSPPEGDSIEALALFPTN